MVSDLLSEFQLEVQDLIALDRVNQSLFDVPPPGNSIFTKSQLSTLTEGIFIKAYTAFEQFTRKIFLKYCCNEPTAAGTAISSYLNPKNENHAEDIIRSSLQFIDWNSPEKLIDRAECYLQNDGFPIKTLIVSSKTILQEFKIIRNHIAHNSSESANKYNRLVQSHFGTLPLTVPVPGEFLLELERPRRGVQRAYKLQTFFNKITSLAVAMASA